MAKPGREARQAMANAVDLSKARMSDGEVYELQATVEMAQGLRCNGCGLRIVAGFHFTSLAPREERVAMRLAACARDDCDYATKCREGGTYVEMVEYVWLDECGPDAPASQAFVKAAEKRSAAEAAAAPLESRPVQGDG